MSFLQVISLSCLLVIIQQVNAAAVDTDNGIEVSSIQLEEVNQKLKTMEETQKSLLEKLDKLLNLELKHSSTTQGRVRRNDGGEIQRDSEITQVSESPNGNANCPPNSCISCSAGPRGYPGPPGPPGRDGRDGRDSVAFVGDENSACSPPYEVPTNSSGGSIYVRWGHSDCPKHSALIYTGSAAGPHWHAAGNGVNQLCLPNDPDYDNPVAGVGTSRASLYSIEYQIDHFPMLQSRNWLDVPCAVCKAPLRFGQLMIPGKNTCPSPEWTLEYKGYLMAERNHQSHQRSMYICVDGEMQSVERTHGYSPERGLLDLVEARCATSGGGLPCGPYIDGYELTCAVCTQ